MRHQCTTSDSFVWGFTRDMQASGSQRHAANATRADSGLVTLLSAVYNMQVHSCGPIVSVLDKNSQIQCWQNQLLPYQSLDSKLYCSRECAYRGACGILSTNKYDNKTKTALRHQATVSVNNNLYKCVASLLALVKAEKRKADKSTDVRRLKLTAYHVIVWSPWAHHRFSTSGSVQYLYFASPALQHDRPTLRGGFNVILIKLLITRDNRD